MSLFVVVAGLLLVAVLAAIIYPLLRNSASAAVPSAKAQELNLAVLREQRAELEKERAKGLIGDKAYAKAREELERRALEDAGQAAAPQGQAAFRKPVIAVAIGLVVPALAIPLYLYLGQPGAMGGGGKPAATQPDGSHALTPDQISAMVERLAQRLQENPDDGQGWLMLAKSYGAMGRFAESATAYGRAIALLPPDAQMLADFADIVAMAQGKSLQGDPERIVRRALEVDPNNIKALALAGTIAFDRQDYPAAIDSWRKILALVPEGSSVATGIQGSIRDAENRMALAKAGTATPAAPAASVSGTVTLGPSLAAAPGDTVFVFARAVDGPKVPLAMMKKTAADLPLRFTLDDSMSMTPNFRLSQHKEVVVGARISKSGDAMARPGDLEGLSAVVSPGAADVRIVINKTVK